jgi:hypothetical protein
MRNINIPRNLAIPNPMAYRNLCYSLSTHWSNIQKHFQKYTENQEYKISRIHIRKFENSDAIFKTIYEESYEYADAVDLSEDKQHLFDMNYKNFYIDDYPEPDLLIGKNYIVKADISNFFPSIYTHSIPWALVGKEQSKKEKDNHSIWFNEIDKFTRNLKNEETHGILIGCHASNLISEIILVVIDNVLYNKNYKFLRNIDDYTCYAETHEQAEYFIIDLSLELKKFNLHLNHKKTEILKLPQASTSHWVRKLNAHISIYGNKKLNLNEVKVFLDIGLDLIQENKENAAIINYIVKILAKRKLTNNARNYYIKTLHHLVLIYPYLIGLFDKWLFEPFAVTANEIENIANSIFNLGKDKKLYEAMSFSVYFSIKYKFLINDDLFKTASNSNDCIILLLSYLHDKTHEKPKSEIKKYKELAKDKMDNEMDEYWIFIYEVLSKSDLSDYWKKMKEAKVSFVLF